jgi:FHS family glucose/mannose:H+ symporter-like MFS transporter
MDDVTTHTGDRIVLSGRVTAAVGATYLLMGILASAYGPLLEHLSHRFAISLSVAGGVLSAHFVGALLGVIVSMWTMERVPVRLSVTVSVGCLGAGCAGVAVAPSWPAFLAGAFVIGFGFGALDIGLNQLVAHSEGPRRSGVLNALNGVYGIGAVAGPILIAAFSDKHFALLYASGAVVAVGLLPAVAGISGRLPFTPRKPAGRPSRLVGAFVIAYVLYVAVETGVGGWMTSDLESVGQRSVVAATLTSGFWAAIALGRLAVALVPSRVPESAIVITGSAIAAVALAVALVGPAAPFAFIVTGLAIAPIFPTGIVWLAKLRPGDSAATSWLFPASMVGGAAIPGGIGLVIARFGIGWAPAVLSALAIGTLGAFVAANAPGSRRWANRS